MYSAGSFVRHARSTGRLKPSLYGVSTIEPSAIGVVLTVGIVGSVAGGAGVVAPGTVTVGVVVAIGAVDEVARGVSVAAQLVTSSIEMSAVRRRGRIIVAPRARDPLVRR
jgi:hypothetical protein